MLLVVSGAVASVAGISAITLASSMLFFALAMI
jgi:hypothetical protein